MASNEAVKKEHGQRPSRLLNLNKSPKAQKLLAATNATDSPLLRLPPEIRCRIYDYAFGSCVVHAYVGVHTSHFGIIKNCPSPQECEAPLLQRRIHRISQCPDTPDQPSGLWFLYENCKSSADQHYARSHKIPVHLLQVCRQNYHEAVLKPFTEASFHVVLIDRVCSLQMMEFLDTLVPAQARAIVHLRISLLRDRFLSSAIASHCRGLKHVELHIMTDGYPHLADEPLRELQVVEQGKGFEALNRLGLKSLRLTVELQRRVPTEAFKVAILEWMGRLEVGVTHAVPSEHEETAAVTEPV